MRQTIFGQTDFWTLQGHNAETPVVIAYSRGGASFHTDTRAFCAQSEVWLIERSGGNIDRVWIK